MLHQGLVSLLAALQGALILLLCTNQLPLHPPSWGGCWKTQPHGHIQSKPTPKGSTPSMWHIKSQRMSWCDCALLRVTGSHQPSEQETRAQQFGIGILAL